ncbi:MAG: iron-containing alcohol dehydrogenase family protein [Firmicutes bacterium]|nr:iron-containing alcohol dehydrogenase family protein [Bacillota bacterium]
MENIDFRIVTKKIDVKDVLSNDSEKSLVVYSETSIRKNNISLTNKNYDYYSTHEITKEKKLIDEKFKYLNNYKKVIAIGGGTAIDICKYLSFKFKIKSIIIPTMISTNAYATNKVALVVDSKVVSLDAKMPDEIYYDEKILEKSAENNLYGFIDIFSIFTALNDWKLAIEYNNEAKSEEYDQASNLLNSSIDYVLNNDIDNIKNSESFIYDKIGESGMITNKYGSGKPESGSEHIFAKALEKEIDIPHVISVGNGITLMMLSQYLILNDDMDYEKGKKVVNALKKIDIVSLNEKYHVSYDLIYKVFQNLKPRKDRYSVVNLICNDDKLKDEIFEKYIEILGIDRDK